MFLLQSYFSAAAAACWALISHPACSSAKKRCSSTFSWNSFLLRQSNLCRAIASPGCVAIRRRERRRGPAAWVRDRLREASAATAATAKGRLLNHLKLPRRGSVTAASENRACLTKRRQSLGYIPPPTPHPIPRPRSVYISVSCGLNG